MYEITAADRTTAPYSSVCYISCEWADGTQTRASGVVVGLNDVLTAHHVVYDANRGGYATRITISPGADVSPFLSQPYGSYSDVGVIYARTNNWDTNGDDMLYAWEAQYDMAVLGMRSDIGVGISLPVSNVSTDFSGRIEGYPAAAYGGTGMMEQPVFAESNDAYGVWDVGYSLGPGASGGPLLRTDAFGTSVVGVLSSGSTSHSTYAGLFGAGNWSWLQNAMQANNIVMSGAQSPANVGVSPAVTGVITYLGTAAGDVLLGTAANENFRGDAGTDTTVFTGARGSYAMGHYSGIITVTDRQSGRDGSDFLAGVERVRFSDQTVNLGVGWESLTIAPSQLKLLEELYVAFFNRVPDADGLAFWIGQTRAGQSIDWIADSFYGAALQYPSQTGYNSAMTHVDFVNEIYRNVLGRTNGADADGLAFWSGALASGTETRGSLVTEILGSAHTFKGNATWGWVADLLDNKAFVAQRYAVELGLNYNTPELAISRGMDIADAVTATDTSAAIALIGVNDGFSTLG